MIGGLNDGCDVFKLKMEWYVFVDIKINYEGKIRKMVIFILIIKKK